MWNALKYYKHCFFSMLWMAGWLFGWLFGWLADWYIARVELFLLVGLRSEFVCLCVCLWVCVCVCVSIRACAFFAPTSSVGISRFRCSSIHEMKAHFIIHFMRRWYSNGEFFFAICGVNFHIFTLRHSCHLTIYLSTLSLSFCLALSTNKISLSRSISLRLSGQSIHTLHSENALK